MEEALDEGFGVECSDYDGRNGGADEEDAEPWAGVSPDAFGLEVPEIDVVGDELAEYDGEVAAEDAVEAEEVGAGDAEDPEYGGGEHLAGALRHDPLHEDAGREESLGEEAYCVD